MSAPGSKRAVPFCRGNRSRATTSGEFGRIAKIRALFQTTPQRRIKVGIGDDAAVLRQGRGDFVWTVDSCVQDVHFRFDWLTEQDIGWRSFHAAVSDLAAMGASPIGALSALELPKAFSERALVRLLDGQKHAATQLHCPVIGGNLSAASALSITTTVLGHSQRTLLRCGARVGDEVWLIGDVGLARAGLLCLLAGESRLRRGGAAERCISAWRRPEALVERGRALLGRAHAAIDVSDGLVGDAEHIAESSDVALEIDLDALERVLSPDLLRVSRRLLRSAVDIALYGGEDYALLATGPRIMRPRWARAIGHVVSGIGVWGIAEVQGRRRLRRGFDHFAD